MVLASSKGTPCFSKLAMAFVMSHATHYRIYAHVLSVASLRAGMATRRAVAAVKRPELRSLTTRMSPMTFTPELDLAMGSRLREPKGSSRLSSQAVPGAS